MKKIILIILTLPILSCQASTANIIINEILAGTATSSKQEFIELYNPTDNNLNINGYKLKKKTQSGTESNLVSSLTGTITAQGYFLISHSEYQTFFSANQIYSGSSYSIADNNTILLYDANGLLLDKVGYGLATDFESEPALSIPTGTSLSRNYDHIDSDNNKNDFTLSTPTPFNSFLTPSNPLPPLSNSSSTTPIIATSTPPEISTSTPSNSLPPPSNSSSTPPTTATSTPSETSTSTPSTMATTTSSGIIIRPGDILINEFVSDPVTGEEEWVELFNATNTAIDLTGWILLEGSGASTTLNGILGTSTNNYLTFKPKGALNNSGDIIILKNPAGEIICEIAYGDWADSQAPVTADPNSIARFENEYKITTAVTKGLANIFNTPSATTPRPPAVYTQTTPKPTYDFSDKIIVTEIFPNPEGSDEEDEFIEIYNNDTRSVNLLGWKLGDAGAKRFTFGEQIIKTQEYLTIYRAESGIALNNTTDTIKLFQPEKTEPLFQISYENVIENQSYSLENISTAGWKWTPNLTPGKINIISSLTLPQEEIQTPKTSEIEKLPTETFYDQIIINEILPDPSSSSEEWIELKNIGQKTIDLINWKLDDKDGGSSPFIIKETTMLEPDRFIIFSKASSSIALNNDEDSVRLFDPADNLISQIDYKKSKKSLAYARGENNNFFWTIATTPGEENIIILDEDIDFQITSQNITNKVIKFIPLEEINSEFIGQTIKTAGTVAVLPGILGSQYFYIVGSPGIQIYNYKKDFPGLLVGDYIEATGELSQTNGELRLKTKTKDDIKLIGSDFDIEITALACEDVTEDYLGQIISVSGQIVEKKNSTLYLDDGTDEIQIYIKKATGIDLKTIKEGEAITAIGLLSNSKTGLRLMPRSPEDITFQTQTDNGQILGKFEKADDLTIETRDKKKEFTKYLLIFSGIILLLGAGLIIKHRLQK